MAASVLGREETAPVLYKGLTVRASLSSNFDFLALHAAAIGRSEFSPRGDRIVTSSDDNNRARLGCKNGQASYRSPETMMGASRPRISVRKGKSFLISCDASARIWVGQSGETITEPIAPPSVGKILQFLFFRELHPTNPVETGEADYLRWKITPVMFEKSQDVYACVRIT